MTDQASTLLGLAERVEQATGADREAAARHVENGFGMRGVAAHIRAGGHDEHEGVQAFARHRIASTTAMREALEPSADTKAAYSGEINITTTQYDEFGDEQHVTRLLPWDTIKDVMAMIRARAALLQDGEEGR